jgi:hypothetical protein
MGMRVVLGGVAHAMGGSETIADGEIDAGADDGIGVGGKHLAFGQGFGHVGHELGGGADDGIGIEAVAIGDGRGQRYVRRGGDLIVDIAREQRDVGGLEIDGGEQHGDLAAGGGDHQIERIGCPGGALAQAALLGDEADADAHRDGDQGDEERVGPAETPQHGAHKGERAIAEKHEPPHDQGGEQQDDEDDGILRRDRHPFDGAVEGAEGVHGASLWRWWC